LWLCGEGRCAPMWDEVAALLPPLLVAVSFCALVFSLLRREIGAKGRDRRSVDKNGSTE
jgi:hypothetical protein